MTPQEFASKIRAKYPNGVSSEGISYRDIPDEDLSRRIIEKYPAYSSQVKLPTPAPKVVRGRVREQGSTFVENIKRIPGELLSLGNKLTGGVGEDIASAIGGSKLIKDISEAQQGSQKAELSFVQTMKTKLAKGEKLSPSQQKLYEEIVGRTQSDPTALAAKTLPALGKTNQEVVGDFVQLGTNIVAAGSLPVIGRAGEAVKGLVEGVKRGAVVGAQQGATVGAGQGLATGLKSDKNAAGVVTDTVLGAASGGLIGGALGGIVGGFAAKPIPQSETQQKFATELTAPKLTPSDKAAAFTQGRVTKPGVLAKSQVLPSRRDMQVAESVSDIVSPSASPTENLDAIRMRVSQIDDGVREYVAQNKVPFNTNQLKARLNSGADDLKLVFASDTTAERTYKAVMDAFLENTKKLDTEGLFAARQSFDQIPAIKKLLQSDRLGENVRKEIVLTVRRQANEYIASLLPKGNAYRALLLEESHMIEAMGNIGDKFATQIGKNQLQILSAQYPFLKWIIGGVATGVTGAAGIGVGNAIINSTE